MRTALVCAVVLGSAAARATPVVDRHPGGAVFVGPTSPHVSAVLWNPAASGLMKGTHILVLGSATLDATSIARAPISTSDGQPGGDRTFPETSPLYVTPGALVGVISDLGTDNFTLGVATILAFAERIPDLDASLGYHTLGGSLYGQSTIFSVSYRGSGSFYAGLGVSLLFTKADLRFLRDRVLDTCAAPPCDVENAASAERWSVETGWDATPFTTSFAPVVSANGGALVRLLRWWFGLAVVFPAGTSGEIRKDARFSILPAGSDTPIEGTARVTTFVPWFVHFGARRTVLGNLELLLHATWTRLSLHQSIDIRLLGREPREAGLPEWVVRHRGLDDVFTFEAGLEQAAARQLRLGARVRFETSAVAPDAVAPDRIDAPKVSLAAGLELRASARFAVTAGYSLGVALPIDVDPGAYSARAAIDCNASGHDLSTAACQATREGRGISSAAGRYSRLYNHLSLGLIYDIW